jgi:hypothetical protein
MIDTNEPNRLVEQPNSLLMRNLLRAGTDVRVSERTRESVLEALGLQEGRSAVTWSRPLPFRRTALLLAAMVVSAAAVAVPLARSMMSARVSLAPAVQSASPEAASPEAATVVESVPTRATAVRDSLPANEANAANADETALETNRAVEEPSSVRSPVQRSNSRDALAAELAALDAVRAKLRAGEPKSALGLLDAFSRDFSHPKLALEAEVLRIDTLDRAGQPDAARKRAAAFVQRHPKGVLTGRVRRYLER